MIKNNNPPVHSRARGPMAKGFSLVELVVSMTGGAAVFCLAIATIEQTMKLSNEGRARAEHQLTVARLGQQFRSDVHQVNEFRLEMDKAVTSPSAAGGGQIEPFRRDLGGGGSRSEPVDSGKQPPPGASPERLAPTSPKQSLGEVTYRPILKLSNFRDAESTITYTIVGTTVTREVTNPNSNTVSRETYRLHRDCSARLESSDIGHLSLLIVRHPPDGGEMLENRIVARIGRLLSLQSLRKGQ